MTSQPRRQIRRVAAGLLLPTALLLAAAVAAQEVATGQPEPLAHGADPFDLWLQRITRAVEVAGIAVIVLGAVGASAHFAWQVLRAGFSCRSYEEYRANLGRAILLGLELLVAADIIGTVAVDPTLYNLGVLAGIVLIRTFLSFSLELEIEGRWPWQQPRAERRP